MRIDFKTYLSEDKKSKEPTHIHHLVFDGHESIAQLDQTMNKMHNHLLDGDKKTPSLVFPRTEIDPKNYTVENQRTFKTHMEEARREYQKLSPDAYDSIGHHSSDMKEYSQKSTGPLSSEEYIHHLGKQHKKNMRVYTDSGDLHKKHSKKIEEVMRNKEHFDRLFKIHNHIKKARNVLVKVMDKNNIKPEHFGIDRGRYETKNNILFVKEETMSSGEAVRGFGDVSGNPAIQDNPLEQYVTTNQLAKDKENGFIMKMMKQSQRNVVGFKEFNPITRDKGLEYYKDDENADPLLRDKLRNRGKNNNVNRG